MKFDVNGFFVGKEMYKKQDGSVVPRACFQVGMEQVVFSVPDGIDYNAIELCKPATAILDFKSGNNGWYVKFLGYNYVK